MKKLLLVLLLSIPGIINAVVVDNQTWDTITETFSVGKDWLKNGMIGPRRRGQVSSNVTQIKVAGQFKKVDLSGYSEATKKSPFTLVIVTEPDQIRISPDIDGALAKIYAQKQEEVKKQKDALDATLNREIEQIYKHLNESALKGGAQEKKKAAAASEAPPAYEAPAAEGEDDIPPPPAHEPEDEQ